MLSRSVEEPLGSLEIPVSVRTVVDEIESKRVVVDLEPDARVSDISCRGSPPQRYMSEVSCAEPESSSRVYVTVTDVEAHSCVVDISEGHVSEGVVYSLQGCGVSFLAGTVMRVRGRKASIFFKHPIHSQTMDRLRQQPGVGATPDHGGITLSKCSGSITPTG